VLIVIDFEHYFSWLFLLLLNHYRLNDENYDLDAEQVTLEDIHHLNDNDLTEEEKAMKNNAQSQLSVVFLTRLTSNLIVILDSLIQIDLYLLNHFETLI
jgi:hypothetical protein